MRERNRGMRRFTEGAKLSGKETSIGRTSGETIDGAEGAFPVKKESSLRQKDRVKHTAADAFILFPRGQTFRFGFF